MTPKQRAFVLAYVARPHPEQAAVAAGYAAHSARITAAKLLKNPKVVAAIEAERANRPATLPTGGKSSDPLAFLQAVMNDRDADPRLRVRAAIAAAPYLHAKPGTGKRAAALDDATVVSNGGGRFSKSTPPPRLVVSNPTGPKKA